MVTNIKKEQMNPFYDPCFSKNGGGYDQPRYSAVVDGTEVVFTDSSCGDFGSRYSLCVGNGYATWGSMVDVPYTNLTKEQVALYAEAVRAGVMPSPSRTFDVLVRESRKEDSE